MIIRKFGTVDAPVEVVKEIFLDLTAWPEWMPSVRSVRVLESTPDRLLAEVRQNAMGRVSTQRIEVLLRPWGYVERQLSGWLRKWEADWRFNPPPEGGGTVVSVRLDLEVGGLGILAPKRMVHRTISRIFDQIIVNVQQRIRRMLAAQETGKAARAEPEKVHIRIFTSGEGLEMWIGDRKYTAHAAD